MTLKPTLNQTDIELLKTVFATKDDLKAIRKVVRDEVKSEVSSQLQDKLGDYQQTLRSDIAQFKDDILTEIVKLREDVTVVTGYKDQIEDHESHLETIETKLNLSI